VRGKARCAKTREFGEPNDRSFRVAQRRRSRKAASAAGWRYFHRLSVRRSGIGFVAVTPYTGGYSLEHAMKNRLHARLLWLVLIIAGTGLVGCGQKGPLYLPDETPQKKHG
jgi:predicted small lipoprotein YifL